jgi:hypothetical protein
MGNPDELLGEWTQVYIRSLGVEVLIVEELHSGIRPLPTSALSLMAVSLERECERPVQRLVTTDERDDLRTMMTV